MVVGNGLIAKAFSSFAIDKDILIFAAGVSNSTTTAAIDFDREIALIKKTIEENDSSTFVYFSTCSIYDEGLGQSAYVQHKIHAENTIKAQAKQYLILRVSNLVGKTNNPTTIINYFINCIKNETHFYLWQQAYRNILDVDDLFLIAQYMIYHYSNKTINIANPTHYKVTDIVEQIETFLQKKANYTKIEKGNNLKIDTTLSLNTILKIGYQIPTTYLPILLKKYYSPK